MCWLILNSEKIQEMLWFYDEIYKNICFCKYFYIDIRTKYKFVIKKCTHRVWLVFQKNLFRKFLSDSNAIN